MNKLVILNSEIFVFEQNAMQKGGVLTYIKDLAKLGVEMNAETIMYQYESKRRNEKEHNWNGVKIKDIFVPEGGKQPQKAFDAIYEKENSEGAVFIISTDQLDVKSKANNVIQIQHGIAFDIPENMMKGFLSGSKQLRSISKWFRCLKNVRRLKNVPNTVCVDYNYYNWYRTLATESNEHRMHIIPNYASQCISEDELREKLKSRHSIRKIVFARRMVDHRGSILFANVAKRITDKYPDLVDITFSGSGPCKKQMQEIVRGYENIHFTEYVSEESINFHRRFDICVVPTIYSEGTSLSLLEAMAAGCVPVSTYVGGLTNIILDGFNGRLCHPDEESFYNTMVEIVKLNDNDFNKMAINSYQSVVKAFYIDKWKKRWIDVLCSLS